MREIERYEEIKQSNEHWLGSIPSSWGLLKLKRIFAIKKDIAGEEGHTVLSVTQKGIRPKVMSEKGQFAQDYSKYQLVNRGEFVMNHMDLLTGWVDISDYDGVTSPDYRVFINTNNGKYDSRYYKYIFQLCYSARVFYGLGQGVAGFGRWRLPADRFLNFVLPVPPIDEQRGIANYLDGIVDQIDSSIEEVKNSIEKYKRWKDATVFEAVTKGLDPNAEMKDSGNLFIGTIPKTWKCVKVARVLEKSKDGIRVGPFGSSLTNAVVSASEGDVKIYGQANLIRKDFNYGDKYVTQETYERLKDYEVRPGDVAVSMMGTIGKCCVVPDGIDLGIMDSHLIKIRLDGSILPKYFEYVYESYAVFEQLRNLSKGSIMSGLNSTIVKSAFVTLPTIMEQKAIVRYLDEKCEKMDTIIFEREALVEDMEKYKRSLIYETVTGKRKVV